MKKWFVRLTLAGLVFVLLVAGFVAWDWFATRSAGEARLAKVLAELEASEPGWRNLFAERNARLAPKEHNAAIQTLAIWNALPATSRNEAIVVPVPKELRPAYKTLEPNQLRPEAVVEAIRGRQKPHAKAIHDIRTLALTSRISGFPFDRESSLATNQPLPLTIFPIATTMQTSAMVCLADGRGEDAVADVRAILGLSRMIGDDPNSVAQSTRIAVCMMARSTAEQVLARSNDPKCEVLQSEFESESRAPFIEIMLLGERLGTDEMLAELDRGITPEFEMSVGSSSARVLPRARTVVNWQLARKALPGQRSLALERTTKLIAANRLPYRERLVKVKQFEADAEMESESFLLKLGTTELSRYLANGVEVAAQLRTAIAALACERYRQQFDHWPARLSEIPKSILPDVPRDPYDDAPLRLANTATGLVVYSVGSDLKDDGGAITKSSTGGVDIGFRLYDPARRGVPAP